MMAREKVQAQQHILCGRTHNMYFLFQALITHIYWQLERPQGVQQLPIDTPSQYVLLIQNTLEKWGDGHSETFCDQWHTWTS